MNVEKLPTDSLYKFSTMLCVVLCISCLYAFVSLSNAHNDKAMELLQLTAQTKMDASTKPYYEAMHNVMVSSKENTEFFCKLVGGFSVFCLVGAIVSGYFWYHKEQKYRDELLKRECEKVE